MKNKLTVYIPAAFAALLWSTAFAGVKIGLQYMSPFLFAGTRFSLAGLLVLLFASARLGFRPSRIRSQLPPLRSVLFIAFLQTFFMYALYYIGLDLVSGAVSAIIMGSSPLFAALVSHWMIHDDKMTYRKGISIGVGLSGIVLLSVGKQFSAEGGWLSAVGGLLLIGAMTVSAMANVFMKRKPAENPLLLNGFQLLIGGVALMGLSAVVENRPLRRGELPPQFWGVLFWLSLVSAVAFSIWYLLLKRDHVKVSELNIWKFLIPACGAALAWLVVPGESFDWISFSGMGVVTLAILIYFA